MKRILIIALAASLFGVSCTKDITRFNEEKKNAAVVPGETLFSNAVLNYVNVLATPNVNTNIFRYTVQYWGSTTYQDEPQYDFTTRTIPDRLWTVMYRDVLADLKESKRIISENTLISNEVKTNRLAICDIMQVNAYNFLLNTYGNVPYTKALDIKDPFPAYDDAKTIYDDLLKRMVDNVAALNPTFGGISAAQDIIYQGNVAAWKKFGNALLMRMSMLIADVDAGKAKSIFEAANAGAFTSSDDNAKLKYLPTTPNTNPLWTNLVESGRLDYVAGKPLLDKLVTLNDPRLKLYFNPNNSGVYVGGGIGSNNTYAETARPSASMTVPDFPHVLLGYYEVEFLRAEAIARGFSVPGTIAEHYSNGITSSILWWGGTSAQASTYVGTPAVAYATATGDWKQKIGFQKWIAMYNQPFQSWTEVRRLDQPVLVPPAGAKFGFPARFTYSQAEQVLNPDSYKAASTAIGGDKLETKLWWDKF